MKFISRLFVVLFLSGLFLLFLSLPVTQTREEAEEAIRAEQALETEPTPPDVVVIHSGEKPPVGDVLLDLLLDDPAACLNGPMRQFGRYVGDWDIAEQISADGINWTPGNGARWKFTCVGGGAAIQDYWVPKASDGFAYLKGFGSNFRIYDQENETWDVVWAGPGGPSFTHLTGKMNDQGDIVMYWLSPVQSPPRRITFYKPAADGWDWLLEVQGEDSASWQPIYKIRATRREGLRLPANALNSE